MRVSEVNPGESSGESSEKGWEDRGEKARGD